MTLVTIDLGDVAGGHHPDDHVTIRAENFRESPGGGITSTAEVKIPLVDGVGQAEVEPGPVVVAFRCQAVADTREKRGVVPQNGPVDLSAVLQRDFIWPAPVVNSALATIEGAVSAAIGGEIKIAQSAATTSKNAALAAEASANLAANKALANEQRALSNEQRVTALESISLLAPESPSDGAVSSMVAQPTTLTRQVLDTNFVRLSNRPVSLADRIPAGYQPTDDATEWISQALTESDVVEWPEGLEVTLSGADGVTVAAGQHLRGGPGAKALIDHAGPGFKVYGRLSGIAIHRPVRGTTNVDVGAWIMPGSDGAVISDVRVSGGHHAAVVIGGATDTIEGSAKDPTLDRVYAEDMTGASSYGIRVDACTTPTIMHCTSLGADLDNIKFRVKVIDPRLIGGRYSGSRGGDGLDAFAGIQGGYIGGGIIFEDNGLNSMVIKTDMLETDYPDVPRDGNGRVTDYQAAKDAVDDQIEKYGLPRQTIVQGVIARRAKAGGVTFHRTSATDIDYANGWPMPLLSDLSISGMLIDSAAGTGLRLNAYNAQVSGVQILNPGATGLYVDPAAREIRLNQIGIRGAGANTSWTGTSRDGAVLAGKNVWLSQVHVDGAAAGAWADDTDANAASRTTRIGYNSVDATVAATHHFAQCSAVRATTAGMSSAAQNYATHIDGSYSPISPTDPGTITGSSFGGAWMRGGGGALQLSATGVPGTFGRVGSLMVTDANLRDASHPVNTTGKAAGVLAFALDTKKLYAANASEVGSVWFEIGGAGATVTPT